MKVRRRIQYTIEDLTQHEIEVIDLALRLHDFNGVEDQEVADQMQPIVQAALEDEVYA